MLNIRIADSLDAEFLYNVRNQEASLKSFFNSQIVSWSDHLLWFNNFLSNQQNKIYILSQGSQAVGYFRVNADRKVSVGVDSAYFGKGYGAELIKLGSQKYLSDFGGVLFAEIKNDNTFSVNSFKKAGYVFKENSTFKDQQIEIYTFKIN